MPVKDGLGNRMKEFEEKSLIRLKTKEPVIIRIDGKAFHTFTRGFQKPFDTILMQVMQETTKYLCENIQNCVLGYTQSDEISLLLIDYETAETAPWFDYKVGKMCSVSASMATMIFNRIFNERVTSWIANIERNITEDSPDWLKESFSAYRKAMEKGALFDSRAFNLPKDEVANYFYWRQEDAIRNSIQMAGRAYFSHSQLQNKSCEEIKKMLKEEKFIDYDIFFSDSKRKGSCVKKYKVFIPFITYENIVKDKTCGVWRRRWMVDEKIPVFKKEGREYIEKLVYIHKGEREEKHKIKIICNQEEKERLISIIEGGRDCPFNGDSPSCLLTKNYSGYIIRELGIEFEIKEH